MGIEPKIINEALEQSPQCYRAMLFTTGSARSHITGIIISIAIVVTGVEHKNLFFTFFFRRELAVKRGWEIVFPPVF